MANIRKSNDGRKRARTMEYIDNQVDINDVESPESNIHIGQHIHGPLNISMSIIDETNSPTFESSIQSNSKLKKRNSERTFLQRQMSDMTLNNFINESNKITTELKGRDHVLRVMKTTNNKPITEIKHHKIIREMFAQRQEKQQINKPISDFALQYGLIDSNGKKSKSRKTSELITDMVHQLEGIKPTLTKRQIIDSQSPLLKIVKLESVCNQILCYCQYVIDREDLVLFLDSNNEQVKNLSVNDEIRIAGDLRFDMNLPELGSVALGITDIRKELIRNDNEEEEDIPMEIIHTYDFNCPCNKCTSDDRIIKSTFDLRSTFPSNEEENQSVEPVYDSFTLALMSKRKFDLRASIIIYNPDKINNRYIFIVRDGIGNCLEIILNNINELHIEIQTRTYIFHQIEYLERIESPKELNRWPYDDYTSPKKLFCFRSINNQVSIL